MRRFLILGITRPYLSLNAGGSSTGAWKEAAACTDGEKSGTLEKDETLFSSSVAVSSTREEAVKTEEDDDDDEEEAVVAKNEVEEAEAAERNVDGEWTGSRRIGGFG